MGGNPWSVTESQHRVPISLWGCRPRTATVQDCKRTAESYWIPFAWLRLACLIQSGGCFSFRTRDCRICICSTEFWLGKLPRSKACRASAIRRDRSAWSCSRRCRRRETGNDAVLAGIAGYKQYLKIGHQLLARPGQRVGAAFRSVTYQSIINMSNFYDPVDWACRGCAEKGWHAWPAAVPSTWQPETPNSSGCRRCHVWQFA